MFTLDSLIYEKMRISSIRFETDCSDLVDMTTNPMEWPTYATEIEMLQRLQEDFEDVSLAHIYRSKNGRPDALAKEVRRRGYIFFIYIRPGQTEMPFGESAHLLSFNLA